MYSIQISGKKNGKEGWYTPVVQDGVEWSTEFEGAPSKLTFTVMKDAELDFHEGATVVFKKGDKGIFLGFVFEKTRDKEHHIQVTAYDQLRYFKNTASFLYENKKASDVLKMLCEDLSLQTGKIEDTVYTIPKRVEDNQSYFDMVLNALDETRNNTGREYVLYDDFGKISLTDINSKAYPLLLDATTAENFNYTSSIDKDTVTQVWIIKEGEKQPFVYPTKVDDNQYNWGILRETIKVGKSDNKEHIAKTVLKAKGRKTREVEINGAFGDLNVRAGTTVYVNLGIGDIVIDSPKLCTKVVHHFNGGEHTMDITLFDEYGSETNG